MKVRVERETEYYQRASQQMTTFITVLGTLVALVMALGAVFAALNTMYSAVAERSREIATIRALGFGEGSVVVVVRDRGAAGRAGRRDHRLPGRAPAERAGDARP